MPAAGGEPSRISGLAARPCRLIMIEAHILDSWTRYDDRQSALYGAAMLVAGLGAPLFLFLAGVSVSLSAASKLRRTSDQHRRCGARSCDAVSRSSVSRSCSVSRPAFSAGVPGGRCSRSTFSTSWDRASWRRRPCGGGAARVAAGALRLRRPHWRSRSHTACACCRMALAAAGSDRGLYPAASRLHELRILSLGGVCLCRGPARRPDRRSHGKIRGAGTRHSHCGLPAS